jgi:hypothetical protein
LGLASYLGRIERIDLVSPEPFAGFMFETYVMQNLLNIIEGGWTEAHFYFWNIQGRHEVDFMIEVGEESAPPSRSSPAGGGKKGTFRVLGHFFHIRPTAELPS